ncbi:MAG: (d)CMP kinase [Bacteroidales bacterium]|jgi:cytidylate kinase|nr:(d)CMP kinase [Bacteroidales bacterium]
MKKIIIAIDGHSSCGKSSMAKALAKTIGYVYIDTGAMYRAVTLYSLRNNLIQDNNVNEGELKRQLDRLAIEFRLNPDTNLPETFLNGENVEQEIRRMNVSSHVSQVSALKFVREAMVRQQQALGRERGIVMDGRDIGTVVFPDAELKIFVTASPEVRAQRRYDELVQKGETVVYEEILANVEQRDHIDQTRAESPLRKSSDALLLDNSTMNIAQQNAWLLQQYSLKLKTTRI